MSNEDNAITSPASALQSNAGSNAFSRFANVENVRYSARFLGDSMAGRSIIRLVQAQMLGRFVGRGGRSITMASSVISSSCELWVLALLSSMASGPPSASSRRLFLTPTFARSVRCLPTHSSSVPFYERHALCPSTRQPFPIAAWHCI